ncbi:MAG: hypothetical protein EZS28_015823 [Streblomastix strix]|uniref:Uncharacterized protein n=1 Tax=Streblomastix strix TaxID=222440 RepID=A0A5J4W134_9EUKA|nr:MAG: hypothetical protein EZS28_015823 [Streblomastix strix]
MSKQQGRAPSMEEVKAFRTEYNFDLRVANKNLEINSESIEIRRYYRSIRDKDMTLLKKEVNREIDQDQEDIQDRGTIKVLEKREKISIETRMNIKPEANRGTKNIQDWNRTHQQDNRNRRKDWDDDPNDDWAKRTQMHKDLPGNYSDKVLIWIEDKTPLRFIATPQPKQLVQQTQQIQKVRLQPKWQIPVQIQRQKGRKDAEPNQDEIDEQEILQEMLAILQREKEQYGIPDSKNDQQQIFGEIDNNDSQLPQLAQHQYYQVNQQPVFSQTAKQKIQQLTSNPNAQQKIASLVPKMINTEMNKNNLSSQTKRLEIPILKTSNRWGVQQRQK